MVDVIGSIVISLSRCCLPNDEGPDPPNIFPRTAPVYCVEALYKLAFARTSHYVTLRYVKNARNITLVRLTYGNVATPLLIPNVRTKIEFKTGPEYS